MAGTINSAGGDGGYGYDGPHGTDFAFTGSGGGSGGCVILHADGDINYTGSISVAGGNGGATLNVGTAFAFVKGVLAVAEVVDGLSYRLLAL